jgi:hypothetical protein
VLCALQYELGQQGIAVGDHVKLCVPRTGSKSKNSVGDDVFAQVLGLVAPTDSMTQVLSYFCSCTNVAKTHMLC